MRRLGATNAALLLTTVLAALVLPGKSAAILQCYCSDCPGNDPTCYGKVCTKQTLFQNGVKISERWRCLNDSLGSCNISSPLLSYECCNSHDFCNNENYTSPFEENANRTSNFGCETTGNDSTNPSVEIMTNCTDSEATDEPTLETNTTTTYPSFVPEGGRFQCHEAESANPQTFNFTFCETTTTCFNSLRIRSDGSRVYKWGCSRDDPAHPCLEENRNRKKKTCCRGWFCNKDLPSEWTKGNDNETTPTNGTTPNNQTTPTDPTRPPPADISTGSPPGEEESPSNCTLVEGGTSSDIKPCAGPGSVTIDLTPIKEVPVTTEIGDFFCYCNTCRDNYICTSRFGCGILYSYDISFSTGGPVIVSNHFCLTQKDFVTCGKTPGLVCCLSQFCNSPHPLNLTEAPPTGPTTEPITADTPSVTEGSSTNQNTVNPSTATPSVSVNPLTPPSLGNNSSDTEFHEEEEGLSLLFYALSAIFAVLLTALVLVMVVLIFCCYGYHKKKKHHSSSPRRQQITTATRETTTPIEVRSKFSLVKVEDRETAEGSKVEHSCATDSTYTQPSSPESTV